MPLLNNILGAISTGLGVYGTIAANQQQGNAGACRAPAGCFQCKMTGRGDIAGCIDALLVGSGGLYPMLVNNAIPNAQVLQAFQNGLAALNNGAWFDQQTSYNYLQQAKDNLNWYIQHYQTANPNSGSGNTATGGNSQTGNIAATSSIIDGVPNSYLIMGGLALIGVIYYNRK